MSVERPLLGLVRAELARAQQLVAGLNPAPLDPQFRIASPQGDRRIAVPLTESVKERGRRLALVSDFMAWTAAPGFILTTELHAPDALVSVGLHHDACAALISVMQREPLSFEPAKILKRENIDPVMLALQPRRTRTITKARLKELEAWFGPRGKFPAQPPGGPTG